jgi:pSer/pThr/pTyr-binding forkhead associated (FHA) protein
MLFSMPALLTNNLAVICPSCDYLNVVAAIRCMSCGSATEGAAAPAKVPETRRPSQSLPTLPLEVPKVEAPPKVVSSASRPPFQSSPSAAVSTAPATPSIKFGLTVLAGPAQGLKYRLSATGAQLGRSKGTALFPEDVSISPLHAAFTVVDGQLSVRDAGSASGIYLAITGTETIPTGGMFAVGNRAFRFNGVVDVLPSQTPAPLVYGAPIPPGLNYAVEEILRGQRQGRCVVSPGPVLSVGKGPGDFSYPGDDDLALRHCEVSPLPDGAMIRDLSGGLGTYVRITGERPLRAGDRLRIGEQTIQVDIV